jgi:acetyltransferase-like isoleucine patch superfamily enzyme
MKTAWHIAYPALGRLAGIRTVVESVLGLIRDIVKTVYLAMIQICTRLGYVDRKLPSSISMWARLDVIPRAPHHERHRLSLGRNSLIETSCVICTWHGDVILKDGASIGISSIVMGPVLIGENSACSQNCFISGQSHLYEDVSKKFMRQGFKTEKIVIGKNVWIGAHSVILLGVKIGDNSIIGAGSTIIEDIPPYSLVVGNPGKIIKKYNFQTKRWERV